VCERCRVGPVAPVGGQEDGLDGSLARQIQHVALVSGSGSSDERRFEEGTVVECRRKQDRVNRWAADVQARDRAQDLYRLRHATIVANGF
jgi:hypothetical protein